jgi:hypothetical protein
MQGDGIPVHILTYFQCADTSLFARASDGITEDPLYTYYNKFLRYMQAILALAFQQNIIAGYSSDPDHFEAPKPCHCERSEAIQRNSPDCFVTSFLAMTDYVIFHKYHCAGGMGLNSN